jgi:hypothetical protein
MSPEGTLNNNPKTEFLDPLEELVAVRTRLGRLGGSMFRWKIRIHGL